MRQCTHQVVTELIDALREFARQLFVGRGERQFGSGVNQIGYRLGLREVNASVEKCTARKFSRQGQAGSGLQQSIEYRLGREDAAVAGDLHHVLASKGAWRAHDSEEHLVHDAPFPHDVTVMNRVRPGG